MATHFVDYAGGNNGNDGLSFANRKKTIQGVTPSAGDTIKVIGSPAPTSLGINTTWTNASRTITLATALNQLITDCETNWTAIDAVNITPASDATNFKENTKAQQIAVGAGFTTGATAFFATGTLNLSGYKQVSFWIRQSAGTLLATGGMSLRLCSDILGLVSVNTIAIPALTGSALNQWHCFTVDTGGALGASIASIALYVDTDAGAQTIQIDNILACKDSTSADSLSLTSLIGTVDSTGAGGLDYETWYGIQSINGTTVKLDGPINTTAGSGRGWSGRAVPIESASNTTPIVITATNHGLTTGDVIELRGNYTALALSGANGSALTVTKIDANTFSIDSSVGTGVGGTTGAFWITTMIRTGYKRETTKTDLVAASTTAIQSVGVSGADGTPITVSGGWDRTAMTTQNLETWFDAQNGLGIALDITARSYITVNKIASTRGATHAQLGTSGTSNILTIPGANNLTNAIIIFGSSINTTVNITAGCNNAGGFTFTSSLSSNIVAGMLSNYTTGIGNITVGSYHDITIGSCNNHGSVGLTCLSANSKITVTGGFIGNTTTAFTAPISPFNIMRVNLSANNTVSGCGLNLGSKVSVNTQNNGTRSVLPNTASTNAPGTAYLYNSLFGEATTISGFTANSNQKIVSINHNRVQGQIKIYKEEYNVITDTVTVHTASGTSWKLSPISSIICTIYNPIDHVLTSMAVLANTLYTVKAWVRRDSLNITAKLVCRGNQVLGVLNDVTATAAAAIDTWEQLTITFTPTMSGVVEISAQAYGGTTLNAWFDDLQVNNVAVNFPAPDPIVSSPGGSTSNYLPYGAVC